MTFSSIVPTYSQDVVAIFRQSPRDTTTFAGGIVIETGLVFEGAQILRGASIIQAQINEHAQTFTHPLENGRNIIDHRIIQPVEIEFRVLLIDDKVGRLERLITGVSEKLASDTYDEMKQNFLDGTLLSIQTRSSTYPDQIMTAMPHEETSAIFDGLAVTFKTMQVLTPTDAPTFDAANASDSNTVSRGKQNPADASNLKTDEYRSVFGG